MSHQFSLSSSSRFPNRRGQVPTIFLNTHMTGKIEAAIVGGLAVLAVTILPAFGQTAVPRTAIRQASIRGRVSRNT